MIIKNFLLSLLNLDSTSTGYNIDLIKFPLTLLNPVEYTKAMFGFLFSALFWTIFVPAKRKYLVSESSSKFCAIFGRWLLIIGVDSPVSIASFIIIEPDNNIQSHGIAIPLSGNSNISPGTKLTLSSSIISNWLSEVFLWILTGMEYLAILLILFKLDKFVIVSWRRSKSVKNVINPA